MKKARKPLALMLALMMCVGYPMMTPVFAVEDEEEEEEVVGGFVSSKDMLVDGLLFDSTMDDLIDEEIPGGEAIDEEEIARAIEVHWGREAMNYVTNAELFKGTGSNSRMMPTDEITRGMFVTVLRRFVRERSTVGTSFVDVAEDD